jgi:hypothetical protein
MNLQLLSSANLEACIIIITLKNVSSLSNCKKINGRQLSKRGKLIGEQNLPLEGKNEQGQCCSSAGAYESYSIL